VFRFQAEAGDTVSLFVCGVSGEDHEHVTHKSRAMLSEFVSWWWLLSIALGCTATNQESSLNVASPERKWLQGWVRMSVPNLQICHLVLFCFVCELCMRNVTLRLPSFRVERVTEDKKGDVPSFTFWSVTCWVLSIKIPSVFCTCVGNFCSFLGWSGIESTLPEATADLFYQPRMMMMMSVEHSVE
jgi:hypothetical protein